MKFTLGWLREHLETDAPLDRVTDTLSAIGLEVEGVTDRAAPLAPFRTARVIEAVQHPNADRLRVCRVDAGTGAAVPPASVGAKKKGKETMITPDQLSAFPTKKTPVYKVKFTRMNLIMAAGPFLP